jgi:hypothetical protein
MSHAHAQVLVHSAWHTGAELEGLAQYLRRAGAIALVAGDVEAHERQRPRHVDLGCGRARVATPARTGLPERIGAAGWRLLNDLMLAQAVIEAGRD